MKKKLLKYISDLKSESFEGWNNDSKNNYLTALSNIEKKVLEINNDKIVQLKKINENVIAEENKLNLSGANLSGADLSGADLSGADLSGADLSGAILIKTDLSGANLSGSNLSGTDLSGAILAGVDLSGVKVNSETKF